MLLRSFGALSVFQCSDFRDFLFSAPREPNMNSERKHSRGTYLAAAVPAEVRIYMAKVAEAYEAEGVSYKRQREISYQAGYEISERSFRRLRACVHEGLDPLSGAKSSGRPKALTDQQVLIFVGWVLNCNKENEKVDLEGSVRFVEEQFAVCVSKETVRGLLLQNGFSSRKGRRRTAGYKFDLDGLIELYMRRTSSASGVLASRRWPLSTWRAWTLRRLVGGC